MEKRKIVAITILMCINIFGIIADISGQSNSAINLPPFISRAMVPDDEYSGIGAANLTNNQDLSMTLAEIYARTEIAQEIYTMFRTDRYNDDVFDNLNYQFIRYIHLLASFEIAKDTKIISRWVAPDGTTWCLVTMKKSEALKYESIIENMFLRYYSLIFIN